MNQQHEQELESVKLVGYGERIRAIRKLHKLTMEEFGRRIGVSAPTIAAYESEQRAPRIETIVELARRYGYSVDYLLCLSDVPNLQMDIKDAYNFFFKEKINWHGKPINPNDLQPFRALLEQLMNAKTGYMPQYGQQLPFEPAASENDAAGDQAAQDQYTSPLIPDYIKNFDPTKDDE